MKTITFPLKLQMKRPQVSDLQDALQLLLERDTLLSNDDATRRELSETLKNERTEQRYGKATRQLVSHFQEEQRLQSTGAVDEPTANALNALLKGLDTFDRETKPGFHIVSGTVRREDGLPLRGVQVRAAHEVEQQSVRLGEDVTDGAGRYTIRYALLPTAIIFVVLLDPESPGGRLENAILFLVVLVVLILLLPWERISSLKAAGVEIALYQAWLDRVIETVKGQGKNIADKNLWTLIKRLEPQIEQAAGSRVLWIDNSPYNVLGERRLLRALGIEIVLAESTEKARKHVRRDGDFDLLISDVRGKEQDPPEAIRFVQEVRELEDKRRRPGDYTRIPLMPVVFFGHGWKAFNAPVQELRSAESCGPHQRRGSVRRGSSTYSSSYSLRARCVCTEPGPANVSFANETQIGL